MISVTTERFRKAYKNLPEQVKESARRAYKQWKTNPSHSSLQFKQIHKTQTIYSVRINLSYRVLEVKQGNTMIWFWIGSHAEYDKLIASL
jgi:mRNA-degrading endonuclease RelE of RelBE toxin-antitoxin system